jgi:release factor glutamine methyltransferase
MNRKLPTPNYDHVLSGRFDDVYEPAEDTFLMLDAFELDLADIRRIRPSLCLEIGCGSGVLSVGLASALRDLGCLVMAVDVNTSACAASLETASANGVLGHLDIVRARTASAFESRLRGKVDVVLCNPPYVPTPPDEHGHEDIRAAWAGGTDGRTLTDEVLKLLPDLLSPFGRCYLVVERSNNPQDVRSLAEDCGLKCETVIKRRAGAEELFVFRLNKLKE